jgi:hypothetical protein
MLRTFLWSLVLLGSSVGVASAQGKVVLGEFEGPGASQVRKAVVKILDDHDVAIVPTKQAQATARKTGAELDTESGRVRVAKRLKLTAFVEGSTGKQRRDLKVTITVYGGRDGMPAGTLQLSAPRGVALRELRATLWEQLGPAISGKVQKDEPAFEVIEPQPEPIAKAAPKSKTKPAAPARRAPVEDADEESPLASDEEPPSEETEDVVDETADDDTRVASALDIHVGARLGTRSFAYSDPMPGLRDYKLSMSPNLALRVRWYPGAMFGSGAVSNIGLDVRGEMLVGVSSTNRTGQKFGTSATTFGIGVRGRLPLQDWELGALLGYGSHSFSLEETPDSDPDVPDVGYGFLRVGLDASWAATQVFTLQLEAAYLHGLAHGEISERQWFPHMSGSGIEAELSIGWSLSRVLGVEFAIGMQRYFMSFDPRPDDPGVRGLGRVAGGALDQYLSTRLGMVIRL